MTDGLCQCGCGQPAPIATMTDRKYGAVRGEPRRFIQGHNAKLSRKADVDFIEDPTTHCWVWQLSKNIHGYGQMWSRKVGRPDGAYRVYYEDLVGPIPPGLSLDHLCRNRACVNPGHLEIVTIGENVLRGESAGAKNARKTHCPKGHPLSGDNLYVNAKGKRRCRRCTLESNRRSRARSAA